MLDKKGKLFGKISIVDIFVVVIILVMATGAYLSLQKINNNVILTEDKGIVKNSAIDTLQVTLRIEEVRSFTGDAFAKGDDVYFADTGKFFGTIASVTQEPAKRQIYDNDGNAIMADVPEHYDVYVVLDTQGKLLKNGYHTADNVHLAIDSQVKIKTPKVNHLPYIHEIKTVTGE